MWLHRERQQTTVLVGDPKVIEISKNQKEHNAEHV